MTKSVSFGGTDTPIEGVTSLDFPRGLLNFGADFRVKSQTSKEVVLTNITSPIDAPEKIRIGLQEIPNYFSGTNVDPTIYVPSKRGLSLLVQLTNVAKETDSADPSYLCHYPTSVQFLLKTTATGVVTAAHIQAQVGRLVSCLYDSGLLTTSRLEALLRGSLVPSEV